MVLAGMDQVTGGRTDTIANEFRMASVELVHKAEPERDADLLREGVWVLSQALMELEVRQHVGGEKRARTRERAGQRGGYGNRIWDMQLGTFELRVPRASDGSYFGAVLEPRKRAERAVVAVVQEAYVQEVSSPAWMTCCVPWAWTGSARAR